MTSYTSWSLAKLKREQLKLEKAIKTKESLEKKQVVAELKAVAKKHGFALSDLLQETPSTSPASASKAKVGGTAKKAKRITTAKTSAPKRRAKAKIKFRNPGKRSEAWTGRGRQPRWVAEYINKGGELSQLAV